MLSYLIKDQTLTHHQGLEKKLVYRIKALNSTNDYLDLLQLFYTYFGGLEDKINQYLIPEQLSDFNQRRKANAIAEDINVLNGTPAAKATGDDLPEIHNNLQAFGALYVIEGSTLGGSIISKMVSSKLGLTAGLGFFNGYGSATHKMWETFRNALNQQASNPDDEKAIIDTANTTFVKFANWIEKHV